MFFNKEMYLDLVEYCKAFDETNSYLVIPTDWNDPNALGKCMVELQEKLETIVDQFTQMQMCLAVEREKLPVETMRG